MQLPTAPQHMFNLRNQTVTTFGYDTVGATRYSFNSLGYRGAEFVHRNPIILLGGTITFGLGLDYADTFGQLIEQQTNTPVYNFAWGAYAHTNHEQLEFLKQLLESLDPTLVIWQINNLNRKRIAGQVSFDNKDAFELYHDFWQQAQPVLKQVPYCLLHWDEVDYGVDFSHCLIYNTYHVDNSIVTNPNTFGAKSNKLIALKILKDINDKRI
jgi:hypothetical protein